MRDALMEINSSNFDLILGHRILFYFFFLENSGRHFSVFWAPIMDGSRALDSFRLSRPIKFESRKPPKNKTNLDPRTATPLGNLITFSFFFLNQSKFEGKIPPSSDGQSPDASAHVGTSRQLNQRPLFNLFRRFHRVQPPVVDLIRSN